MALEYMFASRAYRGTTNYRNEDATRATRAVEGLSATQRAALWQLLAPTTSSRNNPYDRRTGTQASNRQGSARSFINERGGSDQQEDEPARNDGGAGLRWAGSPGR